MERCDFSSIITTVRKYIGDDRGMNQIDLLYELFEGFLEEEFRTQAFQNQIAKELGCRKDQSSLQKRKIQDYQR